MKCLTAILLAALTTPALAQTMYKCPSPTGTINYQQTPCTPTGGGEVIEQKAIQSTGTGGLSDDAKAFLEERDKARQQQPQPQQARNSEIEKKCFDMRRKIMFLEEREARGIHTWSKHGYEESHYLKREYTQLCGSW